MSLLSPLAKENPYPPFSSLLFVSIISQHSYPYAGSGGGGGGGGGGGVLWDHWPLDAVQSSRPDPANEFLVLPPPRNASKPNANATNATTTNATAAKAKATAAKATLKAGGARRRAGLDDDGDYIGSGPWARAEDDFHLSAGRFAGLPCGGRCPDGVYPLRPVSG